MSWEFVKVYTAILDSSIAKHCRTRHVFEDLLKLAKPDGTVDMTLDAICRRTGEDLSVLTAAIAELCEPDPNSRTPDFEGRRLIPLAGRPFGWWIVNYRSYVERGGSTERVRRYRERLAAEEEREAPREDAPKKKARESGPGSQAEVLDAYYTAWMARYPGKDETGSPIRPTLRQADVAPAWTALRRLPPSERIAIVRAFVADDDRLVVNSRHRLGLLTVRLDALRLKLAGVADARKPLTAAEKEKAATRATIAKAREKAAQARG